MGGASEMIATREEMRDAKLDIGYRDFCAHLLIPLNECRRKSFFLPWKCEHERHVYEKCQYKECVERCAAREVDARVRGREGGAPARGSVQPTRSRRSLNARSNADDDQRTRAMTDGVCVALARVRSRRRYMKRVAAMKASKE